MVKTYEITCNSPLSNETHVTYTESDLFLKEYALLVFRKPRFAFMPDGFHLAMLPEGKKFHVIEGETVSPAKMTVRVLEIGNSSTPRETIAAAVKYILSLEGVSMWSAFEIEEHNEKLHVIKADGSNVYYLELRSLAEKIVKAIHNPAINCKKEDTRDQAI